MNFSQKYFNGYRIGLYRREELLVAAFDELLKFDKNVQKNDKSKLLRDIAQLYMKGLFSHYLQFNRGREMFLKMVDDILQIKK